MSITDELRHNIEGAEQLYGCECKHLLAIADRIDAEHEAMVSYWQGASYRDGYDEGFASADDWLAQHEDAMAEHGWVRLPKDADGEYIRIGDEVEWRHSCGSCELRHGIVTGIKTDKIGDEVFYEVTINADRFAVRLMSNQLRHYHAPTVEDVLTEFGIDWEHESDCEDRAALLKEYAAKLKLAEGEDA